MVSLACALFAVFMITLIWCKNNNNQGQLFEFVKDEIDDRKYISLISEHIPKEFDTSVAVIGSLDGRQPHLVQIDSNSEKRSSQSASVSCGCES
eukprot:CAMPEP_0202697190 /NCGR_PEP_ID=MMETSP1385-20130828/10511_1 /ASSEMBLY_ACC=CAM_ASM_000861 /TAXON_ID=933848 /ORGANISM="Elphidium margaritaceum" /LENGTH=93 /DNA_ID=CAMNT_0049353573 /DNA_START=1 /DNA_END=279 /DNA_ORIENTATION=-